MTKIIDDFSELDLTPEFDVGSNQIVVQSEVAGVRSGIALKPFGTTPTGISIYNSDDTENYGFANLAVNPEVPDTVLLTARTVGTGTQLTKLESSLVFNDFKIAPKTPTSATDIGTTGQIAWDSSYMYVCIATNTWKRAAITTW